jgi:hypothetical protein
MSYRKKAEQADARNAVKQEKAGNFAAGGAAGQQGGPANPVDKNNYVSFLLVECFQP